MIFGVIPSVQQELITKFCFGTCGKITIGAITIPEVGGAFPCNEESCPHEEAHSPAIGVVDGKEICLRKLKEEGK